MMLQGFALAALITRCAPDVTPTTMAAIVQVESGGDPFAIDDDTARRSYYPRDRQSAAMLASRLIGAGHLIDAGIAQIDSMNFAHFGLSTATVFDPCLNLRAGATILASDYAVAARHFGNGQVALRHAVGMYNTGRLNGGTDYVRHVLAVAGVHDVGAAPRVVSERSAMRSSVLVATRVVRRGAPHRARRIIAPTRAPILVSSVSRVIVF
ncbi:MAG: lytic transglycosylase domain-containing protein [Candidatus Tyrphobacter sp.]